MDEVAEHGEVVALRARAAEAQVAVPRAAVRAAALGAKGIGQSGTVGSTPAVHNAVVDALSHLGVRHVDMRCTPDRVWRAIQDAANGGGAPLWREPPAALADLLIRSDEERPAGAEI